MPQHPTPSLADDRLAPREVLLTGREAEEFKSGPQPVMMPGSCAMPPAVAQAIIDVMLNVDPVQKKGRNTEHNYKFVAVEDLLKEIQPEMAKAGLIVMQNEVAIRQAFEGSFVEIEYAFTLFHKSGVGWEHPMRQTGLSRLKFNSGKIDDKAYNKCHTSARKYFLMSLFQIPTGDIADNDKADRHDADDGRAETAAPTVQRESDQDAISNARRWTAAAIRNVGGMQTAAALKAWREKFDATITKLETVAPEEFGKLDQVLREKTLEFEPAGRNDAETPY